jgi:tRNA uridine 5-carbamoylmethylation protein Kti12
MTSSATVILICGLPASGKSTLARKLKDHFQESQSSNTSRRAVVHYLEYDAFEDLIVSQQQQQEEEEERGRREAWNQARQVVLKELEQHLQADESSESESSDSIILMDDNFHLRGMRKQIHRLLLLQHRPIQFGVLWVDATLESCLERNRQRERRQIPESVILKMQSTFEPPTLTKAAAVSAWEANWMSVTDKTQFESVVEFVEHCVDIVDLPEEEHQDVEQQQQQEADRAKTLQNQRHAWDKLLRTWVGQVAKYDKQFARGANMARKELLQRIKDPNFSDIGISSSITNDDILMLESFLDLLLASSSTITTTDDKKNVNLRSALKVLLTESSS